jgi:hypothetical protein
VRGIGDDQRRIKAAAHPEVAAQFKENVGIALKMLALVALLALFGPIDDGILFQAQLL